MRASIAGFAFSFLFYLLMTAGSGEIILWSLEELLFGLMFSVLAGLLIKILFNISGTELKFTVFNPKRWGVFLLYIFGPFFAGMVKANFDVAYRVITGKIRPGIVKIPSGLKTDFGVSMLANSITLTPGTLSVDVDKKNNLFVHCIYVKNNKPETKDICSSFPEWVRRITE